jgi:hypothetical protein
VEETLSPEKKRATAIRREVAREVDQFMKVIFEDLRNSGRLDLEATEMLVRPCIAPVPRVSASCSDSPSRPTSSA